jgi:hypothetical protein
MGKPISPSIISEYGFERCRWQHFKAPSIRRKTVAIRWWKRTYTPVEGSVETQYVPEQM